MKRLISLKYNKGIVSKRNHTYQNGAIMLNSETIARMESEQRKWLSQQGNRAREIIRLSQEPPEYSPMSKDFQRFAIIGSVEFDQPIIRTALFFDSGHSGRHEIIIGSNEAKWDCGWYNGMDELSHLIPPVRTTY